MSQLSRIMRTVQPTKTKKPKRKKKPTPKFVKLPRWKPHSMSQMQWEAMQAQHREFEDYTCEVNGWEVPDRGERAPVSLRRWTPSAAAIAYQTTVQSAVNIQRWWRRWRRARLLSPLFSRLFSQVFTHEEDFKHTSAVSKTWIFLRDQHIPADLRLYCDWHPTWERRLGKWRFYCPQYIFRTKHEEDYLIATLIWRNGVARTPNSNHGEILYHPVLKTFTIVQDDTRTFSSFTELLRHMHVLHQLELRRIQRAIIAIQRAWTKKIHRWWWLIYGPECGQDPEAVKIQRWWWMWRFRKWLSERRKYREWVRTNNFLPVMIEVQFPFRQDPLLLGKQLLGVNIDKLPFN